MTTLELESQIVSCQHLESRSQFEHLPGCVDTVHDGVAFPRETGHAHMEPLHLAVVGRGLPQLVLVVGGNGSGDVSLPGLLGGGSLLEEGERVGEPIHPGQVPDVDGPSATVVLAVGQEMSDETMDLGVGIGPQAVEQREHVTVKSCF